MGPLTAREMTATSNYIPSSSSVWGAATGVRVDTSSGLPPALTAMGVALTPDTLLQYCAMQLGAIDKQIAEKMTKQREGRSAQAAMGELQRALSKYQQGGLDAANANGRAECLAAYKKAYDAAPPEMKEKLQQQFDEFYKTTVAQDGMTGKAPDLATVTDQQLTSFANTVGGRNEAGYLVNGADDQEMKRFSDNVGSLSSELGNGAELEMISLQALISQRQMAVQMATNMMSKVNETLQSQVAAIGK